MTDLCGLSEAQVKVKRNRVSEFQGDRLEEKLDRRALEKQDDTPKPSVCNLFLIMASSNFVPYYGLYTAVKSFLPVAPLEYLGGLQGVIWLRNSALDYQDWDRKKNDQVK